MNSRRSLSLWKSCNWTWKPIILLLLGFKMRCKSVLDGYQKPIQTPSGYLTVLRVHNYGSQKIKELDLIYNCGSQQICKNLITTHKTIGSLPRPTSSLRFKKSRTRANLKTQVKKFWYICTQFFSAALLSTFAFFDSTWQVNFFRRGKNENCFLMVSGRWK